MDRGAWWAAVHGVAKSQTQLSDFTFTFHFHALEKEMATHSSVLAWRIPGKGESGGLQSMGSHRVGHDWSDLAAAAANMATVKSCQKKTNQFGYFSNPRFFWTGLTHSPRECNYLTTLNKFLKRHSGGKKECIFCISFLKQEWIVC